MATGSIVPRKSKRNPKVTFYYVKYPYQGAWKWKSAGTSRRNAERLLSDIMGRITAGTFQELKKATFEDFYKEWLKKYAKPRFRSRSLERTESIFAIHLVPKFGKRALVSIDTEDIQGYIAEKLRDGAAPSSIIRHLTPLKTMFKLAVKWGYLVKSPADDVENPKIEHEEMDFLAPDEVEAFLKAAEDLDRNAARSDTVKVHALFMTAVLTGMRRGELLGLMWDDIDWKSGSIKVRRALSKEPSKDPKKKTRDYVFGKPKSKKGVRKVSMTPLLKDALTAWKTECPASELNLVFPNSAGKPMDADALVRRYFKPALVLAGLREVRFHDLRHTNAAGRIAAGQSIKRMQEELGHASVTMTLDRYGHLFESEKGEESKLDSTFFRRPSRESVDQPLSPA